MPGIAGIISKVEPELAREKLTSMAHAMWRESFYSMGSYANHGAGIYLTWSCLRDSFSDCLPIWNEAKSLVLFFSGENFADDEVIEALSHRGHKFDRCNASYLIHLYEERGLEDFLKSLSGFFCGVIIDFRQKVAILFNDRLGMHRVYCHEGKEAFYFSSEAKCLLRVIPDSRGLDEKSLAEYFACGGTLENRTLFKKVFLLPGGSVWRFDASGETKKSYYFQPRDWEEQPLLSKEVFFDKLLEAFNKLLPKYFASKTPVGLSLTGGLDTRMILSCWNPPARSLPCYTFDGIGGNIYDTKIAEKVAAACDQKHYVIRLEKDFFSDFDSYAEKTIQVTDGTADLCGAHEIYLNKLAREIAPVRMTGNYGGEVLRGVTTFKARLPREDLFEHDFNNLIAEGGRSLKDSENGHKVSFTAYKEIPWRHFGILSSALSQLTVRSPYLDNDLVGLAYQAPAEARSNHAVSLGIIRKGDPRLSRIRTDQGIGGEGGWITEGVLRAYYRFLFKMEYYFNDGMPQWLAKTKRIVDALDADRVFLGRHKYLFYRRWFAEELSPFIQGVIFDSRTEQRSFLNRAALRKMVYEHLSGQANLTDEISKVVAIELVHRLLLQQ